MGKIVKAFREFRYRGILVITFVFAVIALILFVELSGIRVRYTEKDLHLLPEDRIVTKAQAVSALQTETLLVWDSTEPTSALAYEQFVVLLDDMKVGNDKVDLAKESIPSFADYKNVIVLLAVLSPLGEDVLEICDWVHGGGHAWFPLTIQKEAHSTVIESKMGIKESSYEFATVDSIYLREGFMIGGGRAFAVPGPFESARVVQLQDDVTVYANRGDPSGIPLVWKTSYGDGCFVVDNFGICDKAYRGFYAASYSLLADVCVYPVINGSAVYLDDFPSQIPEGFNPYISRDYSTTVRDFYINIWWPDMLNLADKFGLKYTGLAITSYNDVTDGTADAKPDTGHFLSFGNMLLRRGGELGYHGFNHQPLCLSNCDYKGEYDYNTWESTDAMQSAFDALVSLCEELFPEVEFAAYVPPSNLLSAEGREFLLAEYPAVKTISGIYFEDSKLDFSCTQEFDVDENGVVDQPRITYSCVPNAFVGISAISELNMHFVHNHFTHPDDALDPERGGELGWEKLCENFDSYLSWVYGSAPMLRNFTATEMSAAVQRYIAVVPQTTLTESSMELSIGNFYDEAQFIVRFNEKEPDTLRGGRLSHIVGDIYLLEATEETVVISFK